MATATKMQTVITQLLERHGIDGMTTDAFLWLALPGLDEQLMIERIDEHYVSVALAGTEELGYFNLVLQLFFVTDATGWTPIHVDGAKPPDGLIHFAEAWAMRILDEGWLEQGEKQPEPLEGQAEGAYLAHADEPASPSGKEELCEDLPF